MTGIISDFRRPNPFQADLACERGIAYNPALT